MSNTAIDDLVADLIDNIDESNRSFDEYAVKNELELLIKSFNRDIPEAAAEQRRRSILSNHLTELVTGFGEHEVPFVVIKYPYLPKPLSDIDILVADPDGAHTALTALGFDVEDDTEPHRETYVKVTDGVRVAVDLHSALSWRRVRYLRTNHIIENRYDRNIDGTSVPCPSPEHHFAITAAHSIFKHNTLSMFEVLEINALRRQHDIDIGRVRAMAGENNWRSQLDYFLSLIDETTTSLESGTEAGSRRSLESFPITYPIRYILWSRGRKSAADIASGDVESVAVAAFAYPLDVTQHVFEDRLGVSMKPLFDGISFVKRRLNI